MQEALSESDSTQMYEALASIFEMIFKESIHSKEHRHRLAKVFKKSRMCESNKRINQSIDLSVYDNPTEPTQSQLTGDPDDGYLQTERGTDEIDYRKASPRSVQRTMETETGVNEIRADKLEFLRQLFKVTDRLDAGGLLLK